MLRPAVLISVLFVSANGSEDDAAITLVHLH